MSRPSTCSTRAPSHKHSAFTESYDGDAESSSHTGSEVDDETIFSGCTDEVVSSPVFQMTHRRMFSSTKAGVVQEPYPLSESDSESETSTSSASVVNYTDSDFSRVQRSARAGLVGSRQRNQNEQNYTSESANCERRIDSTDGVVTLLQLTEVTSDDESVFDEDYSYPDFGLGLQKSSIVTTHNQDRKASNGICAMEMPNAKKENPPITRNAVCVEYSAGKAIEKPKEEPQLTQQEIIQKQKDLKNGFTKIVKDARKTVREVRAKRSGNAVSPGRSKTASKPRNKRLKGLKFVADSKQSESSLRDPTKMKNVGVGERRQISSGSKKLLKQRKKQEAVEINRRQVEILITELNYLNLHEQAVNLKSALTFKETQEKEFNMQLEAERRNIQRMKYAEMCRQKEEAKMKRLGEIREMEEERRKREEAERRRRIEEAKKRREKNRMLRDSYNAVLLANSISRSFTFSYFPKLQPEKRTHYADTSTRVREATTKIYGEKCHR